MAFVPLDNIWEEEAQDTAAVCILNRALHIHTAEETHLKMSWASKCSCVFLFVPRQLTLNISASLSGLL